MPKPTTAVLQPRKILISSHPYFQGGANNYNCQTAEIHANILVDPRSLTIMENRAHVPASFL